MFNKIKQIQELRKQAGDIKKALAEETISASDRNNLITIVMDGNQEVKSVNLSEEAMADKTKLEQATTEAINDAIKKIQRVMAQKMSQFGGFPGM